jgi:hypothetical protein
MAVILIAEYSVNPVFLREVEGYWTSAQTLCPEANFKGPHESLEVLINHDTEIFPLAHRMMNLEVHSDPEARGLTDPCYIMPSSHAAARAARVRRRRSALCNRRSLGRPRGFFQGRLQAVYV